MCVRTLVFSNISQPYGISQEKDAWEENTPANYTVFWGFRDMFSLRMHTRWAPIESVWEEHKGTMSDAIMPAGVGQGPRFQKQGADVAHSPP